VASFQREKEKRYINSPKERNRARKHNENSPFVSIGEFSEHEKLCFSVQKASAFLNRKSAASDSSVGLKAEAFSLIFCKVHQKVY